MSKQHDAHVHDYYSGLLPNLAHTPNEFLAEIDRTMRQIKPLLAGKGPHMQGAILANLVAAFIAGYTPRLRDEMLDLHLAAVKAMIPVCEYEIFGAAGFPTKGLS